MPPLVHAVEADHHGFVLWFLDAGADPNSLGGGGEAPLHRAVAIGDRDDVAALLEAGADPRLRSRRGLAPLHYAAADDVAALLPLFRDAGADVSMRDQAGQTILHRAVDADWPLSALEVLLATGVAASAGDSRGDTALHRAVRREQPELVDLLVDYGASPVARNAAGETPFTLALARSEATIQRFLSPEFLAMTDRQGRTLLHLAVTAEASDSVVAEILDRGAAVNARDDQGRTALHGAVATGNRGHVLALLTSGGDLFARDAGDRSSDPRGRTRRSGDGGPRRRSGGRARPRG